MLLFFTHHIESIEYHLIRQQRKSSKAIFKKVANPVSIDISDCIFASTCLQTRRRNRAGIKTTKLRSLDAKGRAFRHRVRQYATSIPTVSAVLRHGNVNRKYVLDPQGLFIQRWRLLVSPLIMFNSVNVPYRIAYGFDGKIGFFFYFSYFSDLVLLADLIIHFRTVPHTSGIAVKQTKFQY